MKIWNIYKYSWWLNHTGLKESKDLDILTSLNYPMIGVISESFNTNISHQLIDYKITFMKSQH